MREPAHHPAHAPRSPSCRTSGGGTRSVARGSFARWASAFVVAGAGQEVFDFGGIAAHARSQERKRARHRVSTGGCVRPIELTRGDSELARFGLARARTSTTAHLPFAAAAARGAGSRVTVAVPRAGSG